MIPGFETMVGLMLVLRQDQPSCNNQLVNELNDAGFTGINNRIAWAIVNRESNNQPGTVSSGAYGLFQLQANVWSGASWWDWDTVLTREGNMSMAHELWSASGWRPWGITPDGQGMDTRDYSNWSSTTQYSWIWEPYERYWRQYPC